MGKGAVVFIFGEGAVVYLLLYRWLWSRLLTWSYERVALTVPPRLVTRPLAVPPGLYSPVLQRKTEFNVQKANYRARGTRTAPRNHPPFIPFTT